MSGTRSFGAETNEASVWNFGGGVGVGINWSEEEEIRIGRYAHVVAIAGQQFITHRVGAGGYLLTAKIVGSVGQRDHSVECTADELRIDSAGVVTFRRDG